MGYWGKILGGAAGLVMGGPFGAVMGAALGHAADQGALPKMKMGAFGMNPARIAAMLGGRDQLFALGVVVLSAKLAKCDGMVKREEIDAFKRQFRIPPEAVRDVGRMFDAARDSPEGFENYAPSSATRSPTILACWRTFCPPCSRSRGRMARSTGASWTSWGGCTAGSG